MPKHDECARLRCKNEDISQHCVSHRPRRPARRPHLRTRRHAISSHVNHVLCAAHRHRHRPRASFHRHRGFVHLHVVMIGANSNTQGRSRLSTAAVVSNFCVQLWTQHSASMHTHTRYRTGNGVADSCQFTVFGCVEVRPVKPYNIVLKAASQCPCACRMSGTVPTRLLAADEA